MNKPTTSRVPIEREPTMEIRPPLPIDSNLPIPQSAQQKVKEWMQQHFPQIHEWREEIRHLIRPGVDGARQLWLAYKFGQYYAHGNADDAVKGEIDKYLKQTFPTTKEPPPAIELPKEQDISTNWWNKPSKHYAKFNVINTRRWYKLMLENIASHAEAIGINRMQLEQYMNDYKKTT